MADTMDSKSIVSNDMWVRLPPPVINALRKDFFGAFFCVSIGASASGQGVREAQKQGIR